MDSAENKILDLLNAVYDLSEEDKQNLSWAMIELPEEEKKKILVAVYKRYETFEKNANKLAKGFQSVSNDLSEIKEHEEAEKVLLDL